MSYLISVLYYLYPLFILFLDFKELYKKFSRDSKIIGQITLILSVIFYAATRIFLYFTLNNVWKVKEGYFTPEISIPTVTYNNFINIIDLFLWTIVRQLYKKENGIGIIRLTILYGIEIAFLVPFALTLCLVLNSVFHINFR